MSDIPPMTIAMVINTAFGGYSLSREAAAEVARRKGIKTCVLDGWLCVADSYATVSDVVPRNDPDLVAVVREMGARAGRDLKVVDVTISIEIENYDGKETVRVGGGVWK